MALFLKVQNSKNHLLWRLHRSRDLLKVAGYYINSRVSDYFILTLEDIKEIEIVSNPLDFKGDPEAVMLAVESAQTCGIQVWK